MSGSQLAAVSQGYMMKKGHKRKNWTERWFVLRPNVVSYYVGEDLVEKRGDIALDRSCCVEVNSHDGRETVRHDGAATFVPPAVSARQRREEVPVHHQVRRRKLRDQCVGQKEEAGVDARCGFAIRLPQLAALTFTSLVLLLLSLSHSDVHPAAEAGPGVPSPRGPAEAQGAAAAAARRRRRPGGEDEAAPSGQREQTEAAGSHERGKRRAGGPVKEKELKHTHTERREK